MIVLWSGTEVGQDTWVEYTDSKRLNLIKVTHNLGLSVFEQSLRVRFRKLETGEEVWSDGNFIVSDETSCKFCVVEIDENSVTFILYPRLSEVLEYQLEILTTVQDALVVATTGNSVDTSGFDVEYAIDWGDTSDLMWTLEPRQSHYYEESGRYFIRAKARSAGIETVWTLPSVINVYSGSTLVYTPVIVEAPEILKVGTVGTFFISQDFLGSSIGASTEYRFDWGDYHYSEWSDSLNFSHAWEKVGTYTVRVISRIKGSSVMSRWSESVILSVVLTLPEEEPAVIIASVFDFDKTPSPVIDNFKVLVNVDTAINTQQLFLTPYQLVQYKFDFGDGTAQVWTSSTSITHRWLRTGFKKVICQMRVRDSKAANTDWIEFNWSDPAIVSVVERYLTLPSVPECPKEALIRPSGVRTVDPDGLLFSYPFEKQWVSDWITVPGSGLFNISHPLTIFPYLACVEYDVEGDFEARKYEDSYEIVTDGNELPFTYMFYTGNTENVIPINFHTYIESVNSTTGTRVVSIVSRFRLYLKY